MLAALEQGQDVARLADVEQAIEQAGLEPDRAIVGGERVVERLHAVQHDAEAVVRLGLIGLQRHRPAQARRGLVEPVQGMQREAQLVVGVAVLRAQRDRPLIGQSRLIEIALLLQEVAEIDVALDEVRIEPDRPLAGCQRLVQMAGGAERDREVVVGIGEIVPARDRAPQVPDRLVGPAELQGEQPAAIEALGMIGMGQQHPPIERIGIGEPAMLPIGLGQAHRLGGRDRLRARRQRRRRSRPACRRGAAVADALPGPCSLPMLAARCRVAAASPISYHHLQHASETRGSPQMGIDAGEANRLAAEFRANPKGPHSPALQRVLNAMRGLPIAGKHFLIFDAGRRPLHAGVSSPAARRSR